VSSPHLSSLCLALNPADPEFGCAGTLGAAWRLTRRGTVSVWAGTDPRTLSAPKPITHLGCQRRLSSISTTRAKFRAKRAWRASGSGERAAPCPTLEGGRPKVLPRGLPPSTFLPEGVRDVLSPRREIANLSATAKRRLKNSPTALVSSNQVDHEPVAARHPRRRHGTRVTPDT
jgi:hypothetical protein